MKLSDETRGRLLWSLVHLDADAVQSREALRAVHFDDTRVVQELSPEALVSILQRYVSGSLSLDQLHWWADAIEVREDVEYPPLYHPLMSEVIFELANPEIHLPFTKEEAQDWCERLAPGDTWERADNPPG